MNRLTVRYSGIHVGYKSKYNNSVLCSEMTVPQIRECMEKLAAYEDTGFEPEEVKQLNASDVSKEESSIKYYNEMRKYRDELKYYKKLEEQGLLIKLPCKVRDIVYVDAMTFGTNDDIKYAEAEVVSIRITKKQTFVKLRIFALGLDGMPYGCKNYPLTSFGKTVFLTREEAEKALEDK